MLPLYAKGYRGFITKSFFTLESLLPAVVGGADALVAVVLEAVAEDGLVADEDSHDVGVPFAVLALAGPRDVDQVVAVLVVHDVAEGRRGAAAARGVEVDRAAVVESVAG